MKRHFLPLAIIWISLLPRPLHATNYDSLLVSETESWLLKELKTNGKADFSKRDLSARIVSAGFIRMILSDVERNEISKHPILSIFNAQIVNDLDLQQFHIKSRIEFGHCSFSGIVNISNSVFERGFSFRECDFMSFFACNEVRALKSVGLQLCSFRQNVDLARCKFEGSLSLDSSVIHGVFDAQFMETKGNALLRNTIFVGIGEHSFNSVKIGESFRMELAKFEGSLDAIAVQVGGMFSAVGATFKKTVYFHSMRTGGKFQIDNCTFDGHVNAAYLKIGSNVEAANCRFKDTRMTDFSSCEIDGNLFFNNSSTQGWLYFGGSQIRGSVLLSNSAFGDTLDFRECRISGAVYGIEAWFQDVTFQRASIGSALMRSQFHKSLDFSLCLIDGPLELANSVFTSHQDKVSFNTMRLRGGLFLTGAVFYGGINLAHASIDQNIEAKSIDLKNPVDFDMSNITVGKSVYLDKAKINGRLHVSDATIQNDFSLDSTSFTNGFELKFSGTKIGTCSFTGASLVGAPHFSFAKISGSLFFQKTKILGGGNLVINNTKIEGQCLFEESSFSGNLSLYSSDIAELLIVGTTPSRSRVDTLDLTNTTIRRDFFLVNYALKRLSASGIQVFGKTFVKDISIAESVNLFDSDFEMLAFVNVQWPSSVESNWVDEMKYRTLNGPQHWPDILGLLKRSQFSPNGYVHLEQYLMRQGLQDAAIEVFAARKDREREKMSWYNSIWNRILWLIANHGKSPERLLMITLGLIAIGTIVFRKDSMVPTSTQKSGNYNPLWYSLSVFLPGVSFGEEKDCDPYPIL